MNIPIHIIQPLNSGGNGDLYLGRRADNGELVVVKYLREYQNPHARKAFAREVHVLARKIPGQIQLLAANLNAEIPHYVMPFVTGGSLTIHAGWRITKSGQIPGVLEVLVGCLGARHRHRFRSVDRHSGPIGTTGRAPFGRCRIGARQTSTAHP